MRRPINDGLDKELRAVFSLEATERLQAITEHLIALEKKPGPEKASRLLDEVFREAHSLKGAARAVNIGPIESVAHHLETLLRAVQVGGRSRDKEFFDLIYGAVDAVGSLAGDSSDEPASEIDVAGLCERLEIAAQPGNGSSADEDGAATPDPGLPSPAEARRLEEVPASPGPVAGVVPDADGLTSTRGGTVRVTTAKLDSLFSRTGELLAARVAAEKRLSEVEELGRDLSDWQTAWRKVRPSYRRLLLVAGEQTESLGKDSDGLAAIKDLLPFLQDNERRLRETVVHSVEVSKRLESDQREVGHLIAEVHDDVRRTRMMTLETILQSFPRMVRDLAHSNGKRVSFVVRGGETEMDRSVLERIRDPLTHVLRNCIDHGLEHPEERGRAGKPLDGTITLTAAQQGDAIRIEVEDDGAGIDPDRVVARAIERGLLSSEEAMALSERETLWLIFRSGFSTSPMITDLSGRGVGLDVVRETVERLHGTIEVDSRIGEGTTFTLVLPLTLATTFCLLVEAAGQAFGLPVTNVGRIVRVPSEQIAIAQKRDVIRVDEQSLVLARLESVLDLPTVSAPKQAPSKEQTAVIVASGEKRIALLVDRLLGTQAVALKNLPRPLGGARYVAGATILGTGELVVVLNASELVRSAGHVERRRPPVQESTARRDEGPSVIVIADDSITTRTLEKNILETAGFQVRVAADGVEAWTLLIQEDCDLLVSDVNMPRLNGFDLTAKIRGDDRFKNLPVVLVTSLDKNDDRERGIAVGADAYMVKSSFDQDRLLETVRRLI